MAADLSAPAAGANRWARVIEHNLAVYKRTWRSSIFFSFLHPLLFLLAMGLGLGSLIERTRPGGFGGAGYLAFLAPGVLAAACMQTATFEFSFPTISKVTWYRNYEAMLATPLLVRDIVAGELGWGAVRLVSVAVPFYLAMVIFGLTSAPLSVLAVPAAVLTGLAFAGVLIGYSAPKDHYNDLTGMFRFVITPLFLFSGTFFPVERLPEVLQPVAYATPLYQGVALVRGFALGTLRPGPALAHTAYLLAMAAGGAWFAHRKLRLKMET